jgi:NADP-dependent 3-hydroxy acid dehydrogenase YdfG
VARRAEALKSVSEACAAAHKSSGVKAGGQFVTVQLDVSDRAAVAKLFDNVPENLKKVDVLGASISVATHVVYLHSCSNSEQRWVRSWR